MKRTFLLLIVTFLFLHSVGSQNSSYSYLEKDTLVVGNNLIERKFFLNKGNLITYSLTDKKNNQCWLNSSGTPDFVVSKNTADATKFTYSTEKIKETVIHPEYLEVTVCYTLDSLSIMRKYRIYDDVPVIVCNTYLKGRANNVFGGRTTNTADMKNIEFAEDMKSGQVTAFLDQINLSGKHWKMKTVEFYDVKIGRASCRERV